MSPVARPQRPAAQQVLPTDRRATGKRPPRERPGPGDWLRHHVADLGLLLLAAAVALLILAALSR